MSNYSAEYDDDSTIVRVDDNLTETGGLSINQLRDAVFAIQRVLGLLPEGSSGSVANRLDASLNANGTIKASALTSIGLATLPIVDNQVASNAGIKESKLQLDFSTSDLHALILANDALLDSLSAYTATIGADLLLHIGGANLLSNGSTSARHVASHIDLNAVPSDSRDISFTWTGLLDKNGNARSAETVAEGLLQINNALTAHENATLLAHPATAITVNTDNFSEIPNDATTVQAALDAIDNNEVLVIGEHRANQHANGIPRTARSQNTLVDGYNQTVVPETPVSAYLVRSPVTTTNDDNTDGDDIVSFEPTTGTLFDSQFSQVKVGDIIRINYGNHGLEASYPIDSIRFVPGSERIVRLNGYNLRDTDGYTAYARIDRPLFDTNTKGVLACAAANNDIDNTIMSSVIVGHPRGACAVGIGFDANKLDSTHYKLYLELYPSGDPDEKVIQLPFVDVTGNAGATPGSYTLQSIINSTNNGFRAAGYNYRFIAFEYNNEFGVMLADVINNASFAIVSGIRSGVSLAESTYTENVIGDANDGLDPLGLGAAHANIASPAYSISFSSSEAAKLPTKVIVPLKRRNYHVNGGRRDNFETSFMSVGDGYWPATIISRIQIGTDTIETTYRIDLSLEAAELKPGKTIVVQPDIEFDDLDYLDSDYGRFVIKEVNFTGECGEVGTFTTITVVNGVHATGDSVGLSSGSIDVRLYFSEDSVSFNRSNVITSSPPGTTYNRFHEVYINNDGKTFSHERIRLPQQSETATLLNTSDGWNIKFVSPKLRGWTDSGSTSLEKYVRFYVLSYNSTSGEYDGYLGRRATSGNSNVTNTGKITTGRKNIPVRFYDDTNIDYIEIEFTDTSISPGSNIMSTDAPRYVDIQVFPSLGNNDEAMMIAGVDLDDLTVERVWDLRQFGSISEKHFTDSAIDFIRAGDRYLHANGIVRGFDFVGINDSDPSILEYSGGIAIVNGGIVAVNPLSVEIPEIRESGLSLPQIITWAVCVNETGQLVPIVITDTKKQFFGSTGSNSFYVQSVSFEELIFARKDLTIISLVTAVIASITLTHTDARKFVFADTQNIQYTWVGDNITGHFTTLEQVKNWINGLKAHNNVVKVRGNLSFTTNQNFSDIDYPTIFEGDGATITSTFKKSFSLGSNITFKNIKFVYNPTGLSYTAGNLINADLDSACIHALGSYENITIENCTFTSSLSNRPPFISLIMDRANTIEKVRIINNEFEDTHADSSLNCCVLVLNTNTGASTTPAALVNCIIDKNHANKSQSIALTSEFIIGDGDQSLEPGLVVCATTISNNIMGAIGVLPSSKFQQISNNIEPNAGLRIVGNTCKLIGSLDFHGKLVDGTDVIRHGSGNVIVESNFCSNIILLADTDIENNAQFCSLVVARNILRPIDENILQDNWGALNFDKAIYINGDRNTAIVPDLRHVMIIDNDIGPSESNSIQYGTGILAWKVPAIVRGNSVKGFTDYGIRFFKDSMGAYGTIMIQNNSIFRWETPITAYIQGSHTNVISTVIVTDNFFDRENVDGTSSGTGTDTGVLDISGIGRTIIERNVNQTVTMTVRMRESGVAWFNSPSNPEDSDITVTSITGNSTGSYGLTIGSGVTSAFEWNCSLEDLLPEGARVVSASIDWSGTATTIGDSNTLNVELRTRGTSDTVATTASGAIGTTNSGTVTITPSSPQTIKNTYLSVGIPVLTTSGSTTLNFSSITLNYRWL